MASTPASVLRLVAQLYYERDLTLQEIAALTGFSVSKVSRLHRQALDEGIVRITVEPDPEDGEALEARLAERFGLRFHVTSGFPAQPLQAARLCGAAAGPFVAAQLPERGTVGFAPGFTTSALATALPPTRRRDLTFVPLVGGWDPRSTELDTNILVRTLADKTGGRAIALHAPATVDSPDAVAALLRDPSIAEATALWNEVDVAVIGVSGPTSARPGYRTVGDSLAAALRDEMERADAVGEIVGHFFDVDGRLLGDTDHPRIAISIERLGAIGNVIAVLAGSQKARSLVGVARTGLVDTIVTDAATGAAALAASE